LSSDRIQELEKVEGWVWDEDEAKFQEGLKRLKKYVKENQHAIVPQKYTDESGFRLGGYVSYQQNSYKRGDLSSDRIQELEKVEGWVWDRGEAEFQEVLKRLKKSFFSLTTQGASYVQ
jgi:hypothetical protein